MSAISAIRVPSISKPAKAAIIFVHGLGDTGEGWSWFPQYIKQAGILKNFDSINYVFPNAPKIPVTANGGYIMPGWFDIIDLGSRKGRQDEEGFLKSCDVLKQLIKEQIEVNNIPAERIIIGGFSQGAAISLATLGLLDFKIGGVVALSGFCPIMDTIARLQNKAEVNISTPIFQAHGTSDPVVDFSLGEKTSEFYKSLGFSNLKFKKYPGLGHSADDSELSNVLEFVSSILE